MKSEFHAFKPTISEKSKIVGKGNIRINAFSMVEDLVLFDTGQQKTSSIVIGNRCKIKQGAILRTYDGNIVIGDRVSIGEYTNIAGHGNITIGDCTIIAGHCYISAANHMTFDQRMIRFQGETSNGIKIGKNVWIGGHVLILDGVKIGEGCVIGAGSVVTSSLPPSSICYGIPCRVIKKRKKQIELNKKKR